MTKPVTVREREAMNDSRKTAKEICDMSLLPKSVVKRMRVVALRQKGLTLQEVADEVGVTRQAVHAMLKTYAKNVDSGKWSE